MSQQSVIGRIMRLARTDLSALIEQAEDPPKMLDQLVRDCTSAISDAEGAASQTIGNLRMMSEDAREAQGASGQWGAKAAAASRKAEEMRAADDTVEADTFDNLARVALRKQIDAEADARTLANTIADQNEVLDKLKVGLEQMRGKLGDLRRKRDELVGRAQPADAADRVRDTIRSVDVLDPTHEVARFDEKIRREEARIRGFQDMAASSLDAEFERLDVKSAGADVDARLAELKAGTAGAW